MKETRRKLEFFAPYDYDGMTSHFEQMALDGWLIVGVKGNLWKYKKIQPQKLKFAVTHFEKFTFNEAAPDNGQSEFLQMCESSGWQLAAHYQTMMVFMAEAENAVPIETDPMIQLKNIEKSVKPIFAIKNTLIIYNVFRNKLLNGMERIIDGSYKVNYTNLLISLVLFVLVNIDTMDYIMWHLKANNVLKEQGMFYSKKTNKPVYVLQAAIRFVLWAIVIAFFAFLIWFMGYIAFSGEVML